MDLFFSVPECGAVALKKTVAYSTGPEKAEFPGGSSRWNKTFGEGCTLTYVTSSGSGWVWCLKTAYVVQSFLSPFELLFVFFLPSFWKETKSEKLKNSLFFFFLFCYISLGSFKITNIFASYREAGEESKGCWRKGKACSEKFGKLLLHQTLLPQS